MRRLLLDPFLLSILAAIALAFAAPELGADGGPLRLDAVLPFGVATIFLLHGLALSPAALKAGVAAWRLHALIQGATYVFFPLVGAALFLLTADLLPAGLRLGVFFLCAAPSTISSAIAFTGLAKGNVAGAVFNASLSGLIGVFATPALAALAAATTGQANPLADAIRAIALTLLAPFALGQLLRPLLAAFVARHKARFSLVERAVIVLIVYGAFCNSAAGGVWGELGLSLALAAGALCAGLLALALWALWRVSGALGFPPADRRAALFGGSTKSLASGAPMAGVLFAGDPALGLIVLPLLFYHQLQLLVCAILARRLGEERPSARAEREVMTR